MKGYATLPNCVTCGRFCTEEPGASWRMVYSGEPILSDGVQMDRVDVGRVACAEIGDPVL